MNSAAVVEDDDLGKCDVFQSMMVSPDMITYPYLKYPCASTHALTPVMDVSAVMCIPSVLVLYRYLTICLPYLLSS